MNSFEKQEVVEEELATFKASLPVCDDAPLMVRLATDRIHAKLFDPRLTIRRLRNHLGITGATFSVRFRQYHGRTPKRYARHLRVEAAKQLLLRDELAATAVALAVGYKHYRSFARLFKRHTGDSPSAFRNGSSQ